MTPVDAVPMHVRQIRDEERAQARGLVAPLWGGDTMVVRGEVVPFLELPAFVATDDAGVWLGYASYRVAGGAVEVMSIDAFDTGRGVGSALLDAVAEAGRASECDRFVVVTTNDNRHALAWYQRRGFTIAEIRRGAVDEARALKPSIPLVAGDGTPIRDEIELVRALGSE